jgi:hypothetical protein
MSHLKDKLNIFVKELKNIFNNCDSDIKKMLEEQKIITRNRKISFSNALLYKFLCSYKNNTNTQVCADLNFKNILVDKSNYYKKEQKIPLKYYQNILSKMQQLFDKYTNKNLAYNIIAVDGTYNNTNFKNDKSLETTLNMGYYNVSQHIPINIELKDHCDKNKEILSFKNYIENKDIDFSKMIFVMDRAYFSYDLFKLLNDKNIKFIIRVKDNCTKIKKNKKKYKNNNNDNNDDNNEIRYISHTTSIIETKKDKNNTDKEKKQCLIILLQT